MKTKDIAVILRNCGKTVCHKCALHAEEDCIENINQIAADHLMELENQVKACNKHIEDMKKTIHDLTETNDELKSKLNEGSGLWISVEERLPEVGEDVLIKYENNLISGFLQSKNEWCCYTGNGWVTAADESESPTHWMPLPKPPKKVKTYKDVFLKAFPNGLIGLIQERNCVNYFFPQFNAGEVYCGDCESCWNQPYEEEGEAE